uniref:Uncharacterized protein n=1 Tax=Fagus sylvatica TaxID=28930 RepID=A0A2N9HV97_FAGSY
MLTSRPHALDLTASRPRPPQSSRVTSRPHESRHQPPQIFSTEWSESIQAKISPDLTSSCRIW